jgi:hypothetical protein
MIAMSIGPNQRANEKHTAGLPNPSGLRKWLFIN